MTDSSTLGWTPGHPVRFNTDNLGLIEHPGARYFAEETVGSGDLGEYVGPHPDPELAAKDWRLVRVVIDGRELYCPCHVSCFEAL